MPRLIRKTTKKISNQKNKARVKRSPYANFMHVTGARRLEELESFKKRGKSLSASESRELQRLYAKLENGIRFGK
jgi:hypothetical protein